MIDHRLHPDLLARLDPETRHVLIGAGRRRAVPRGGLLFESGDPHAEIYIILRGRVRLSYHTPDGRCLTFAYWQDGAMIGSAAAHNHSWSGQAVADTEVIAVASAHFAALLRRHHALALAVLEIMEFKTSALAGTLQLLILASVAERLTSWLGAMMDLYGHPVPAGVAIRAGFTHHEIAEMIGASRQWVTIELGRLRRAGLIETRKGEITILRPASFGETRQQPAACHLGDIRPRAGGL